MKRHSATSRLLVTGALGLSLMTGLSACGLPVAQPADPDIEPYERPALRAGEASGYMEAYSEKLNQALQDDHGKLDTIQSGPLLDRTRAELPIAEAQDETLSSAQFDSVVAGGPTFGDYPMWFIGFGHSTDEEAGTQALLVTRESAASEWTAQQGLFIPDENVPTLVADENGAVAKAPASFIQTQKTAAEALASYLSNGDTKPLDSAGMESVGEAFSGFRDYVGSYSGGDNAFDSVKSECQVYDEIDMTATALSTQDGAVGFGEVRCTITLEVPSDYAVTLSESVEAVTSGDTDGNKVTIETSIPYVVRTTSGAIHLIGSDWFLLEARTEET